MNRRSFLIFSGGSLAWPPRGFAQAGKTYRVGLCFQVTEKVAKPLVEAFVAGLKDHGHIVGRNLVLDVRYGDGGPTRLPGLVDELIALKPDVLAGFEVPAKIMKAKTATIPIVLTNSSDPVGIGLVQSLRRPGGNVTGISTVWEQVVPKNIELMREILPRLARVGLLLDTTSPGSKAAEEKSRSVAAAFGATIVPYYVTDRASIDKALAAVAKDRLDALFHAGGGIVINFMPLIVENAQRLRIPMAGDPALGALFSYNSSLTQAYRDAARFVARILEGAKPAELPIEQPTRFQFVLNLKAARALGIKVPHSVMVRADRVIE